MLKKIKFGIQKNHTENDKYLIETEVDIEKGVKDVNFDWKTGECQVEFDDEKVNSNDILNKIKKLGYQIKEKNYVSAPSIQEHIYFTKGMHCASCELIIEKTLLKEDNIKSIEVSANKNLVVIEHEDNFPSTERLNNLFKKEGYVFSNEPIKKQEKKHPLFTFKDGHLEVNKRKLNDILIIGGISLLLIVGFMALSKSGWAALISVNAKSALPMFLVFGLLAGLSSCAALVGGIVLSMSKQWSEIYAKDETTLKKLQPHLLFNAGRLASYGVLGGLLGGVGSIFQLSLTFNTVLILVVSVMMLFLALQMLGIKYFQRFQITAPKFITRYIADEKNFGSKYMPALMGGLTFFLPCGFTITAQGLALASGSIIQGGLIMLFFALGTLPILLVIGLSSVKLSKNPYLSNKFLKIAGVMVFFFAIFNINSQLNVLGWTSLSDIDFKYASVTEQTNDDDLPPIVNGKQILKMDALAFGYSPNKLRVRAGIPVRWEIADRGTGGCTNAIMARGLFEGEIALTPGRTSIKEFTPEKPGKYKFSCWMGMVSGIIEVVDSSSGSPSANVGDDEVIPSGAKGCGCGGGDSGGSCGG